MTKDQWRAGPVLTIPRHPRPRLEIQAVSDAFQRLKVINGTILREFVYIVSIFTAIVNILFVAAVADSANDIQRLLNKTRTFATVPHHDVFEAIVGVYSSLHGEAQEIHALCS